MEGNNDNSSNSESRPPKPQPSKVKSELKVQSSKVGKTIRKAIKVVNKKNK